MRLPPFSPAKALITGLVAGVAVCVVLAVAFNLTGTTRFCAACHSMQSVSAAWQLSTHKQFACVECHLPDTHVVGRVAYKMAAGTRDFVDETLGTYLRPIAISKPGAETVNRNCLRCHFSVMEKTALSGAQSDCLNCHRFLVHGRGFEKEGLP